MITSTGGCAVLNGRHSRLVPVFNIIEASKRQTRRGDERPSCKAKETKQASSPAAAPLRPHAHRRHAHARAAPVCPCRSRSSLSRERHTSRCPSSYFSSAAYDASLRPGCGTTACCASPCAAAPAAPVGRLRVRGGQDRCRGGPH